MTNLAFNADAAPRRVRHWPLPTFRHSARILRVCDLLLHPVRHARVERALRSKTLAPLRRRQPRIGIKYLHPRHLALGLTTSQRAEAMIHHYGFLDRQMRDRRLLDVAGRGILLWGDRACAGLAEVVLVFSDPTDNEGELSLELRLEGVALAVCSFTFAPGRLVDRAFETVLLVTRLQGFTDHYDQARSLMKEFSGLSCQMVLMAALRGIAEAFLLKNVFGVAAAAQVSRAPGGPVFLRAYDEFFLEMGARVAGPVFYELPELPIAERPLSEVKSNNRKRVRHQRLLKDAIAASAVGALDAPARPVVFVSSGAFARGLDGAQARMASALDALLERFPRVVVYSARVHDTYPWTDREREAFASRWPGVGLRLEEPDILTSRIGVLKNAFLTLVPQWASTVLACRVPLCAPLLRELRRLDPVFFVNHKFTLSRMNGVDLRRCVVDTHDVLCLKYAKISGADATSLRALAKMRGEIAALDRCSAVVAISPSEASLFKSLLARAPVHYVGTWATRLPPELDRAHQIYDLVYVASAYVMNVRGLLDALARLGPALRRYRIAICGGICVCEEVVNAVRAFEGISLLGFVEDLDLVYARSKVALAPVEGTGLKVKILGALQRGLPCLVSADALKGLPPGYGKALLELDERTLDAIMSDEEFLAQARADAGRYLREFTTMSEAPRILAHIASMA